MNEAMFYSKFEDGRTKCLLCPHNCTIALSNRGICGVRQNIDGKLFALTYGKMSSIHPDPIEKKPLYHFLPGTLAMSLGTVGCNFRCDFCQNSGISQSHPDQFHLDSITEEEVVKHAIREKCNSIAWTYNEPTLWYEFTHKTNQIAHKNGIQTLYVTNGYINPEPLKWMAPHLDAMNIDVKSFRQKFYKKYAGAKLKPVLDTCKLAKDLDIHIELTYLVIPGLNDGENEISQYMTWVLEELGPDVPLHFSAFHPDYKMRDRKRTPTSTLINIYKKALKVGLNYVFLGNVLSEVGLHTICPACNGQVVKRNYMGLKNIELVNGRCPECKTSIPIVLE